jgi:hypothetical protein
LVDDRSELAARSSVIRFGGESLSVCTKIKLFLPRTQPDDQKEASQSGQFLAKKDFVL